MKRLLLIVIILIQISCYENSYDNTRNADNNIEYPDIKVTTEIGELENGRTYTLTTGSTGEDVQVFFSIENRGGETLKLTRYPEICGGIGEVFELNMDETEMEVEPGEYTVFSLLYSPGNNSIYEQSFVCIRIISNAPDTEQYDIYAVYDR